MSYLFDLTNDGGALAGDSSIDIGGFFQYDMATTGSLDPDAGVLTLAFSGGADPILIDGSVDADRVSLDTTMP